MEITYEEFLERFGLQQNHLVIEAPYDGCMFESYGIELSYVQMYGKKKPNHIWTVINGDEGTWIVPGYHFVNRAGHLISNEPWETEQIDVNLELEG